MSDQLPKIKQVAISGGGILIIYGNQESNSATWRIVTDEYDNAGRTVTIHYSLCSKCGQQETGFPAEAGIYCRRCGSFMVNGQPGQFSIKEWFKSMETGPAAEGGESEGDHADAD